jgi:NTE family protein
VAADIATGEPVLLNKGSFSQAIRASMSIPTVFTPVEIDGRLLVDGGLVRNFPVEEVKAMGADIVIGVFVSSDLNSKEELNNLISVLTQSAFVTSAFDSRRQKEMVDIYIEPDIKDFNTGSFKQSREIIEKGNEMGALFYDTFKHLADSLSQFGPLKTIHKLPKKDEYLITDINIVGNKKIASYQIKGKLKIKEGSILSIDEIEKQIALIYGTRYFDKVDYEIIRNGPKYELRINVDEAPDGYLKLAVQYDSESDVGIRANVTYRNLLFRHSRALFEFDLSKNPRLDLNYLKYIGERQNAGIQIGLMYINNVLPFYEDNIEISRFDANYTNLYVLIQSTSFQNFTFGGKFQLEYSDLTPTVGELGRVIDRIQNRDIGAVVFAKYNNFDRRYFPRKGNQFSLSFKQVFQVKNKLSQIIEDSVSTTQSTLEQFLDPFVAFEAYYTHIFPLSKKLSLITRNAIILTTLPEPEYNITDYYFMGGFNPIFTNVSAYWGANDKEFIAANYFYTNLALQYEVYNNLYITVLGNYLDVQYPMELLYDIQVDNYLGGEKRRIGYGLSLGYNSPLGPITFSIAKDTKYSKTLTNINFGFWVR